MKHDFKNLGRLSAIEGSNFVKKSSMGMREVQFSPGMREVQFSPISPIEQCFPGVTFACQKWFTYSGTTSSVDIRGWCQDSRE
jgi:hypothetical protein